MLRYLRLVFIILGILLILVAGVVWLLNARGVVKGDWAITVTIVFAVMGVLFAFLQWMLPLPVLDLRARVTTSVDPTLFEQLGGKLDEGYGIVMVYLHRSFAHRPIGIAKDEGIGVLGVSRYGQPIRLYETEAPDWKVYVGNYSVGNKEIFGAVFPQVGRGNWVLYLPHIGKNLNGSRSVVYSLFWQVEVPFTVQPGQVVKIDLRTKSLRAEWMDYYRGFFRRWLSW